MIPIWLGKVTACSRPAVGIFNNYIVISPNSIDIFSHDFVIFVMICICYSWYGYFTSRYVHFLLYHAFCYADPHANQSISSIWRGSAVLSESSVWSDSFILSESFVFSDYSICSKPFAWSESSFRSETSFWSNFSIYSETSIGSDSAYNYMSSNEPLSWLSYSTENVYPCSACGSYLAILHCRRSATSTRVYPSVLSFPSVWLIKIFMWSGSSTWSDSTIWLVRPLAPLCDQTTASDSSTLSARSI
jgi:hypothetical protein